jgi:UDP:flavonoid glycosyltransferase YjiC (YdhE family)
VEREVDAKRRKGRRPDRHAKSVDDLGACLRISFSAENHDSLSDEIRRLMLHLSRESDALPKL